MINIHPLHMLSDLSDAILKIIPTISNNTAEIYHYSNIGHCSRYDLAVKINELLDGNSKINPTKTNNYFKKDHCIQFYSVQKL